VNRKPYKGKRQIEIWTIPNLLSCFRLCLIPLFVWLYCARRDDRATALVLVLSGLTDVADGFIARRFDMISDVGKILDPVADKLTQAAMFLCLISQFPWMVVPLCVLVVKEIFMGVSGFLIIRRTGEVLGARWHGKAATLLLYTVMTVHVVWYDIPVHVSYVATGACTLMMVLSLFLYGVQNIQILAGVKKRL